MLQYKITEIGTFLKYNFFYLLLILSGIVFVLFVWHIDKPFPSLLNWDIYEHQTLINYLKGGRWSAYTPHITDTFTFYSYPPTFHILILILQKIFFVNTIHEVLLFWYIIEPIYTLMTIGAVAFFAYVVTKDKILTVLSTFFGIFIFESFGAYTLHFLIPQNLTALLSIIVFTVVYRRMEKNQKVWDIKLILSLILLLAMHFVLGPLGIATIIFYYLVKRVSQKYEKLNLNGIIIVFCVLLVMILIFNSSLSINILPGREESLDYNLPLFLKNFHLHNWYGILLYVFIPSGIFFLLKNGNKSQKIILLISIGYLIAYFFPLPYSVKFLALGHYFLSVILGFGVYLFVRPIRNNRYLVGLILTILLLSLGVTYYFNQLWYKNIPSIQTSVNSHFSKQELAASEFLKSNYGDKNVLLVSEPATQYVLEAFSEINSQGGAYMDEDTRKILISIGNGQSPERTRELLFSIKDKADETDFDTVLLALSGRYFEWQHWDTKDQLKFTRNLFYPMPLTRRDNSYIKGLANSGIFKEVFSSDELVILEVNKSN